MKTDDMTHDMSETEIIQLALSFGAIRLSEISLAKEIIHDHSIDVFLAFLRARGTTFRDAAETVYGQLGTSKSWVDEKLKGTP